MGRDWQRIEGVECESKKREVGAERSYDISGINKRKLDEG